MDATTQAEKLMNSCSLFVKEVDAVILNPNQDSEVDQERTKRLSSMVADIMVKELKELPRIGYNIRRETHWREVKAIIEKR